MEQKTLKQHIEDCQELIKRQPKLSDAKCIYSSDDQGNSHHMVFYDPTPGKMVNGEFNDQAEVDDWEVVCIN